MPPYTEHRDVIQKVILPIPLCNLPYIRKVLWSITGRQSGSWLTEERRGAVSVNSNRYVKINVSPIFDKFMWQPIPKLNMHKENVPNQCLYMNKSNTFQKEFFKNIFLVMGSSHVWHISDSSIIQLSWTVILRYTPSQHSHLIQMMLLS